VISYRQAQIVAVATVAAMTAIASTAAPFVAYDPAFGLVRWHALLQGAPLDSSLGPDPADIARDVVSAASWWSPGQYLAPGILTLTGMRLGVALVVVASLSNLAALLGWIAVARAFALGPLVAMAATVLIAAFRYSSSAYGVYSGGEILLQAATPWIVLAAWRVPQTMWPMAALLGFAAVALGFAAKLNGLIVAASAFAAAGTLALYQTRRVSPGLIGGALGAVLAALLIYVFWFAAKPMTHLAGGGEGFGVVRLLFALSAPWTAAFSWQDFLVWLLQTPGRVVVTGDAPLVTFGLTPLAALLAAIFVFDRDAPENERALRRFTGMMLAAFTAPMLVLYLRDAPIPLEERHFRPVAMLLLLCLLARALRPSTGRAARYGLLGLFGAMACYGLVSFGARVVGAQQQTVDAYSRTLQPNVDAATLEAMRRIHAEQGRDAVFYLGAPELSAALPYTARAIIEAPGLMSEAAIAATPYRGRAKGSVIVVVSNDLPMAKVEAVLRSFADYDAGGWTKTVNAKATVYRQ
jgi:hypothetical protein